MQKFNIKAATLQKELFNTIQIQDIHNKKQQRQDTLSNPVKASIKKPQASILVYLQEKKSLQKVLILPLMDVKHYREILDQSQPNHKQERLQFTTHYMQQMTPTNHKKYFRYSLYANKKHQKIDSNITQYNITRSVDLKKEQNSKQEINQSVKKSPQILQLQNHIKSKSFICPIKHKKGSSILSSIQTVKNNEKSTRIERMLSRYQNLQLQNDGSGRQWMSRWLIGRKLTNQKEHS